MEHRQPKNKNDMPEISAMPLYELMQEIPAHFFICSITESCRCDSF